MDRAAIAQLIRTLQVAFYEVATSFVLWGEFMRCADRVSHTHNTQVFI